MTVAVFVFHAIEEIVRQRRQATVQSFAAAADGADDLGAGLKGSDGGGHFVVGNVLDVLVDVINYSLVIEIGSDEYQHDREHNCPETPSQHANTLRHEIPRASEKSAAQAFCFQPDARSERRFADS